MNTYMIIGKFPWNINKNQAIPTSWEGILSCSTCSPFLPKKGKISSQSKAKKNSFLYKLPFQGRFIRMLDTLEQRKVGKIETRASVQKYLQPAGKNGNGLLLLGLTLLLAETRAVAVPALLGVEVVECSTFTGDLLVQFQ